MHHKIKRIAINTGGGDAPGLNAVIRAATLAALERGWEVLGLRKGYFGIIHLEKEDSIIKLDHRAVRGITHLGGTILGTTNKGNPFEFPIRQSDGTFKPTDISDKVIENLNKLGVDALVAVGGDGSLRIANGLAKKGLKVVGVPKTIDNDLSNTVITFGFDTAVGVATDAIDRLHSTAEAHERVMVVEVMGRYAGWIALNSGVAASADVILIPEIPFFIEKVCEKVLAREAMGTHFSIVVVAEGAKEVGGRLSTLGSKEIGREVKLGGVGEKTAHAIQERTGKETRCVVLGHLQRGGTPTTFDRLIALRFGAAAIRALDEGQSNIMVALDPPNVRYVSLESAIDRMKAVSPDCDTVKTARDLGVSFGD